MPATRTAEVVRLVGARGRPAEKSQLQKTRELARAMIKQQRLKDLYESATAEVGAVHGRWAGGRRISLDEAREHLTSTGHLEPRKLG